MKFFVYLSTAKVEMLHRQLDKAAPRQRQLEWKIDLKVASVSRTTAKSSDEGREKKLAEVLEHIERSGEMGSVEEPKSYVKGAMPMRWGIYRDIGRPDGEPRLVYFGARSPKFVIGLGGSVRHVLGMEGCTNTNSRSVTPYLVHHLLQGPDISDEGWNSYPAHEPQDETNAFEAVAIATHQLKPPTQNLEFVARTLLCGKFRHNIITKGKKCSVILGTPLYVAYARPYPDANPWKNTGNW